MWAIPDAELGILGDVDGLDAIELGCGTAFDSARLARMGARVVGVDPTPAQLDTARRMQAEFGLDVPLIQAFAEDVPLPDASFDLAHSEYGASLFTGGPPPPSSGRAPRLHPRRAAGHPLRTWARKWPAEEIWAARKLR